VEHGTPRRSFARKVLDLYQNNKLSVTAMDRLLERQYGVAVITIEEDRLLNKSARSKVSDTPEGRRKAAGIEF
jgi:hypothetical protein